MEDINKSGGIIKEKFGDNEAETFQREEITENDYNMGQILDRKLELNRGEIKTFKPQVGSIRNLATSSTSSFQEVKPSNESEINE